MSMSFVTQSSIAFTITPGKQTVLEAPADLRLGQVALGEVLVDQKRSCLKITYVGPPPPHEHDSEDEEDEHEHDDEEQGPTLTVNLANLIPGVIETQTLGGIIINAGEKIILEATGKNTLHISGNIILQEQIDEPPFDETDDEEDDEGDFDDEEIDQLTPEEKNAFLKELSRLEAEEETMDLDEPAAAASATSSPATKKQKKEKKPVVAAAATTTTETTTTTTTTAVAVAASPKQKGAEKVKDSKKRKEVEDSPAKDAKVKKAKGEDGKPVPAAAETKKEAKKEKSDKKPETRTTPSGLKITDKKVGDGPSARRGQKLHMRYILRLANGKVVDKNTTGKPFNFKLGGGEVIKGWDEGLVGIKVGGERTLEVPPQLGYGKKSMSDIPANSTLFFEIKCVDLK